MAATPTYSTLALNTKANAQAALLNGGFLDLYDGTRPASCDTAVTTQTRLARVTFGSPAFGAAVAGVATSQPITPDADASATGDATWCRASTSGGQAVMDGSVGTSGCNVNLTRTSIVQHAAVSVSGVTITEKAS